MEYPNSSTYAKILASVIFPISFGFYIILFHDYNFLSRQPPLTTWVSSQKPMRYLERFLLAIGLAIQKVFLRREDDQKPQYIVGLIYCRLARRFPAA